LLLHPEEPPSKSSLEIKAAEDIWENEKTVRKKIDKKKVRTSFNISTLL